MENKLTFHAVEATIAKMEPVPPTITFSGKDNLEILKLEPNGDIYVKGNLIENDKQVTTALKQFLVSHGYL